LPTRKQNINIYKGGYAKRKQVGMKKSAQSGRLI